MSTLEKAIELAAKAHAGQKDKHGEPYILHPLRVMLRMKTEEERIVAVLHDVIEDTEVDESELYRWGFSDAIIDAVSLLTRRPIEGHGEKPSYQEFIRAVVATGPLAIEVKIADLLDNLMPGRELPGPEGARLRARYSEALAELLDARKERAE